MVKSMWLTDRMMISFCQLHTEVLWGNHLALKDGKEPRGLFIHHLSVCLFSSFLPSPFNVTHTFFQTVPFFLAICTFVML